MADMQVVEHWWNESWGTRTRRDLWLRRDDAGSWSIRVRWGNRPEQVMTYDTEDLARAHLETLLSERGPWSQLPA